MGRHNGILLTGNNNEIYNQFTCDKSARARLAAPAKGRSEGPIGIRGGGFGPALFPLSLLHVSRRRGQSVCRFKRSLWLGRHRHLWLGLLRNWRFWCSRGRLGLTAVRPRKIISSTRRGGHCLALRQNFRGNRVALDRIAAGSSKEFVRSLCLCPSPSRSAGSPAPSVVARSADSDGVPRTVRKAAPRARDYSYSGSIPVRHNAQA